MLKLITLSNLPPRRRYSATRLREGYSRWEAAWRTLYCFWNRRIRLRLPLSTAVDRPPVLPAALSTSSDHPAAHAAPPTPHPEGQHDQHDPEHKRVYADEPHQRQQPEARGQYQDQAEDHREHTARDQGPLALDLPS